MNNLERFRKAQQMDYQTALAEIKEGKKRTHWIWYIFPQLKGLGFSYNSEYYGISRIEKAKAFLADEYLGEHLREISEALLNLDDADPLRILGSPDDKKVRSCMTLFKYADGTTDCIFDKVLKKFYSGKEDMKTLMLLNMKEKQGK